MPASEEDTFPLIPAVLAVEVRLSSDSLVLAFETNLATAAYS
jgi:hypothetical protein